MINDNPGDGVEERILKFLIESDSPWAHAILLIIAVLFVPLLFSKFRFRIQNYFLKTVGNDDNVGFRQASSVYRLLIRESFSNLLGCYFDNERRLGLPGTKSPLEDEKVYESLKRNVDTEFERVMKDIESELTQWKFRGVGLKLYLNEHWRSEVGHIKAELINRLVTGTNGGREYLRNKQEFFIADFAIWLKGVEENGKTQATNAPY